MFSVIQPVEFDKQRLFHQWKATTTSLVHTLDPQTNRSIETVLDVADSLEDLLEPFKSRLPWTAIREALRDIAFKAIALDEIFCGQQSWYYLSYPEKKHDFITNSTRMRFAEGSSSARAVRFVIRPSLSRAGGWRGENFNETCYVEPPLVWA